MNPKVFFGELKRRNVYKVAIAYGVVAWLLIQGASIFFPTFEAPAWVMKVLIGIIVLGFPSALIFAWAIAAPSRALPQARAAPVVGEKSIAVLPFDNLSEEAANAFFADGVHDEILSDLARIADLKVISRTSVMQYRTAAKRNLREIASELGVAHIVEGSVQRAGNRVRVRAQLIDARSDAHLWAERYDRPLDDIFAIQTEIAKAVADQLQAKLSPAEETVIQQPPTADLVAYDRYLRAKEVWTQFTFDARAIENLRQGTRLLEQAVAHDPGFYLAYCQLARANGRLYFSGADHSPLRLAQAKQAVEKALSLAPERGEAHLASASIAYHCYRDYEAALAELAIARRSLPNDPSIPELAGFIARRRGDWQRCREEVERAAELDPRNVALLQQISLTYQLMRRYDDMAGALDRAIAASPGDVTSHVVRALIRLESHADVEPARKMIQEVVAKDPAVVDAIAEQWFYVGICARDPIDTSRALASMPREGVVPINVRMPRDFCAGVAALANNDVAAAEKAFVAAAEEMRKLLAEQPDYAEALSVLGISNAVLGRDEEAISAGCRAVELFPVTKDAVTGSEILRNLAITYAWAGEKSLALQQLEEGARIPGPISYGQLRLHPWWDPLRSDPRFEKIVNSLAPKEASK